MMLLCKDAIQDGMDDHDRGVSYNNNPYVAPDGPEYEIGYHGAKEVGLRRVRIDFRNWWSIGWNIAAKLSMEKSG